MTQKYKCGTCVDLAHSIAKTDKKPSQIFMGWNKQSLPLINHSHGLLFPAHLTKKAGMDMSLVHILCATMPQGI